MEEENESAVFWLWFGVSPDKFFVQLDDVLKLRVRRKLLVEQEVLEVQDKGAVFLILLELLRLPDDGINYVLGR